WPASIPTEDGSVRAGAGCREGIRRDVENGNYGSDEERGDDLREVVARPVQAALHCAQVARGDLGDLLVGLPLELAEDEDRAVMLRQLLHRRLDHLAQVPLPEQV